MTQSTQLFEWIEIREPAILGVQAAVDSLSKELSKELTASFLPEVLATATSELVSAIAGKFVGNLLKRLLTTSISLDAKVDQLLRAPLRTGLTVASHASSLPGRTEQSRVFRDARLMFAIEELDRAMTLRRDVSLRDAEELYILLIQGLCALEMRGGEEFATERLGPVVASFNAHSVELQRKAAALRKYACEAESRAEALVRRTPPPAKVVMGEVVSDPMVFREMWDEEARSLLQQAANARIEAQNAERDAIYARNTAELLTVSCQSASRLAEQSHAPPAAGSVSTGASSPPAR